MRRLLPLFALAIVLSACSSNTAQLSGNNASRGARVTMNEVPVRRFTSAPNRFSIAYPETWSYQDGVMLRVHGEEVRGVAFMPPASMTSGTPVKDAKIHVARTEGRCPSSVTEPITLGNHRFSTSSWSDSSDEGIEQAKSYFIGGDGNCYTITLYTNTCRNDGCTGNTSRAFQRKPLTDAFRQMSASLNLL